MIYLDCWFVVDWFLCLLKFGLLICWGDCEVLYFLLRVMCLWVCFTGCMLLWVCVIASLGVSCCGLCVAC